MQPGDVITLTVGGDYYATEYSDVSWPLAEGIPVYAQVDSWKGQSTYGAVIETHEITGGAYNNITGPVLSTASVGGATTPPAQGSAAPPGNLPSRP